MMRIVAVVLLVMERMPVLLLLQRYSHKGWVFTKLIDRMLKIHWASFVWLHLTRGITPRGQHIIWIHNSLLLPVICLLLLFFSIVPQPDKPDKTAADPNSWIGLECTATEKFSATGAYKQNVPYAVYSSFSFIKSELESGWFAILIEPDDKDDYGKKNLTKVCELIHRNKGYWLRNR